MTPWVETGAMAGGGDPIVEAAGEGATDEEVSLLPRQAFPLSNRNRILFTWPTNAKLISLILKIRNVRQLTTEQELRKDIYNLSK